MKYLFFDTETNGLPKDYKAHFSQLENWPRIIQLGWVLVDDDGTEQRSFCQLIKPDGWEIPEQKFWIDNGYSTEKSKEEGMLITDALAQFISAINVADLMIAHNLDFDFPIVAAEMIRANMKASYKPAKLCTMKTTVDFCVLPGKYGFKCPKLEELHDKLFASSFEGAHDALNDVRATIKCFFELKNKHSFYSEPTI